MHGAKLMKCPTIEGFSAVNVLTIVLAAVLLVPGCGVFAPPGHEMDATDKDNGGRPRRCVVADADKPPQGAITPISPTLVKIQLESLPRMVPADVAALFGTPKPYTIGPSDVVSIIVYDHP